MERSESEGFNQSVSSGESSFVGSGSSRITSDESSGGITDRIKSVGSSVKDKAAGLPGLLADGLEAGAKALKGQQPSAVGTDGSSVAVSNDSSISAVTSTLASGMQSSADWLREADIEKLKAGVENQVKEHPARSLLIALGAGYLIGKALRR